MPDDDRSRARPKAQQASATEYVVFRADVANPDEGLDGVHRWEEIGRASAATPKAAIKAVTDGGTADQRTGTFVATPARSWRPVKRAVEPREHDVWS
jgi:hypothetical protein